MTSCFERGLFIVFLSAAVLTRAFSNVIPYDFSEQNRSSVSRPVFLFHGVGDNAGDFKRHDLPFRPSFVDLLTSSGFVKDDIIDIPLFEDPYSLLWPFDIATISELLEQCAVHGHILNKSLTPILEQVDGVTRYIRKTVNEDPKRFRNGYDLLCHSQGGVICTGVVAHMNDGNFHSLISLAGPQLGVYYGKLSKETSLEISRLLYTDQAQKCASIANLWHDPDSKHGFMKTDYFPKILSVGGKQKNLQQNFIRLKAYVLAISPEDGAVSPWQSAIWGFYGKKRKNSKEGSFPIVDFKDSQLFRNDILGMRQLYNSNRLHRIILPNVRHMDWMHNSVAFKKAVLPYLSPTINLLEQSNHEFRTSNT